LSVGGKGLGLIASKFIKKGTLILKEQPQIPIIYQPYIPNSFNKYLKVISYFDQMCQSDQKEYLELHDEVSASEKLHLLKAITEEMESDPKKAEKVLKIVCIYQTNAYDDGLRIKTARINHSCQPNAIPSLEVNEIRAISDIEAGQEITISYSTRNFGFGMRSRENRQKILKDKMNFICECDFCKEGEEDDKTVVQLKIEELIDKVTELQMERVHAVNQSDLSATEFQLYSPQKCRNEVDFYKQLYKLGKDKKCHPFCLYLVLWEGYRAASFETELIMMDVDHLKQNENLFEEFEKDCVMFSKAAEGFGKFLGKEFVKPELWRKRHQNYKKYLLEEMFQNQE